VTDHSAKKTPLSLKKINFDREIMKIHLICSICLKIAGMFKANVHKAPGDQVQSSYIIEPGPQEPCREIFLKHL
jgi:hypothetical protein